MRERVRGLFKGAAFVVCDDYRLTWPMTFIFQPASFVPPTICIDHNPLTCAVVVPVVTIITRACSPSHYSMAILLIVGPQSIKCRATSPRVFTLG